MACLALLVFAIVTLPAASAFGWAENGVGYPGDPMDCPACHCEDFSPFTGRYGPHNGYTTTTTRCAACHTIHGGMGGVKLLPATTLTDACYFCHDGSGGMGVYGTLAARGVAIGATHRIDQTNVVPGGDGASGGSAVRDFNGEDDFLTCDDCHNPHDAGTVAAFSGERPRFHVSDLGWLPYWETSHLLKKRPTGSPTSSDQYGSDWCAGCHRGRLAMNPLHNHPVDSVATDPGAFYYNRVAAVSADNALTTVYASLGLQIAAPLDTSSWSNRGFVMPDPRTPEQTGHDPICQQCHEDARIIGEPGAVQPAHIERYGDGMTAGDVLVDNPLFQTFPHEGQNDSFLVETEDNLCLNCHAVAELP